MAINKDALLKARIEQDDVEIAGVGTVRIRGLSRDEVIAMRKATDNEHTLDGPRALVIERKMLALAMVDPVLTEDEVKQWQKNAPSGELEPLVAKLQELCGMAPTSEKDAMRSFRGQPGARVRDVPGAEAGDDGGAAASGDE